MSRPRYHHIPPPTWVIAGIFGALLWWLLPYNSAQILLILLALAAWLALVAWLVGAYMPVIPPQNGDDNK